MLNNEDISNSKPCCISHCGDFAVDKHHRKQRSAGGSDSGANLVRLCRRHHDWVHKHLLRSHDLGLIVWDHEDEPNDILRSVRTKPIKPKPVRPKLDNFDLNAILFSDDKVVGEPGDKL
jgi:hypothetical protein